MTDADGLHVFGLSDPTRPGESVVWLASAPTPGSGDPGSIVPDGEWVYVADFSWGLLCFRMESTFADAPPDHWATHAIELCVDAAIVSGHDDGAYRPGESVTRDQMAVYIARALAGGDGNVPEVTGTPSFPDVDAEHWAFDHIEYAVSAEVVAGYADDRYRPEEEVTRDQMAVYLARARAWVGIDDDISGAGDLFEDVPAGFWAGAAIAACLDNGVTHGYEDDLYRPSSVVTRDQMAVFVARAFELAM
jgi:endo-1,4-beta-xylanase